MVYQILDFLAILLRQAIARGIWNVNHRGSCLNHGLYHTCQVFIIRTSCIFRIKLHVFHILLGIFHGSHGSFDDFFTSGVKLIFNMVIRCSYARVNTLVLGIFQGLGSKVYIFLYGTCQGANSGPRHRLGNFYYWIEVARTGNGEACLDDVNAQLLQLLCHLNLLYGIQLASWYLFAVAKGCVENK